MYPLRPHLTLVNVVAAVVHLGLVVGGCVLLVALADALWGATNITYTRVLDWSAITAAGVAAGCVAVSLLTWRHRKAAAAAAAAAVSATEIVAAEEDLDTTDATGNDDASTALVDGGLSTASGEFKSTEGGGGDPNPGLTSSHLKPENWMTWSRAALAALYSVFTQHSQRRLRVVTLMALGAVVLSSLAKQDAEVAKVATTAIAAGIGGDDDDDNSAAVAEALSLQVSALRRAQVQVATALVLLAISGLVLVGTLVRMIIKVVGMLTMPFTAFVCTRARAAVKRLPGWLATPPARVVFRTSVCALVATVLVLVQMASWGSLAVYDNAAAISALAFLTAAAWGVVLLGVATSSAAGAGRPPTAGEASDVGLPEATALAMLLTAVAIQVSLMDAAEAATGSMRLTVITALAVAVTLHLGVAVLMGAEGLLFASMRALHRGLRRLRKGGSAASDTAAAAGPGPGPAGAEVAAGVVPLQAATFLAVGVLGVLCAVLGFMGAPGIINIHNVHAASGVLFTTLLAVGVFALAGNMVLLARVHTPEKALHVHEKLQHSTMVLVFAVVAAWPILWTTNSITGTVSGLTLLLLAGAQTLGTFPWRAVM